MQKISNFKPEEETEEFISILNDINDIRYLANSFSAKKDYILRLDRAVFDIRRFCQSDNDKLQIFSKIKIEDIIKSKNIIFSGVLEKIIKNGNKKYNTERNNLVWKNFYYGERYKKRIKFANGFWSKSSAFFDLKTYKAVKDYVYVPNFVRSYFEDNKTDLKTLKSLKDVF